MNKTINKLKEYGISPSLQRMAIMNYLENHCNHPTVEEIFHALSPSIPTLSKTTVYNTLRILADSGAILSLTIDEKNVRYDGDTTPHAHFKCKECGNVYDVIFPEVASPEETQFEIIETQVYYIGYCEKCKNNHH